MSQLGIVEVMGGGEPDSAVLRLERPGAPAYDHLFLDRDALIEHIRVLAARLGQPSREQLVDLLTEDLRDFAGERTWSTLGLSKD